MYDTASKFLLNSSEQGKCGFTHNNGTGPALCNQVRLQFSGQDLFGTIFL